ncbi:hypothetical protein [Anaeromyxobacter soli]|uniref:hypothetical protein n=1 Tax=Anaeromyxobacter soli TaxID=2922725 RepID=UPI001FAFF10E|nr:hypothetical protein [Anaeromyxobacter sp. SG29]
MDVRVDSTEASAVLDLLARRAEGRPPTDADLARLYATDAYVRLERRETEMKRAFTDAEFRAFVTSDALLDRRAALQRCFAAWQQADLQAAAERARRNLPTGARLRATVYLVVKPNSFVFELATNPAIFFAVGADARGPAWSGRARRAGSGARPSRPGGARTAGRDVSLIVMFYHP